MAVQEDILPVQKLWLTLVLGTAFTVLCVLAGQVLYYAVQDHENQTKIEERQPTELLELRREQLNQIHEYRVTDKAQNRISIPIGDAMTLTRKDLAKGR